MLLAIFNSSPLDASKALCAEFCFRDLKGRQIGGANSEVSYENPTMIRVYRDEVSRHLIDEGKRLHPDAITFHFDSPITRVDFEKRIAHVSETREVTSGQPFYQY